MPLEVSNRFLDPVVLAQMSSLELIAKTVVDGFVAGLHRSPDFGFSQEFAEYRAYSPGDDLRHVDWNVYARTERAYLKRYRGETNTTLMVMIDASASMSFRSGAVAKLDYARYLASALVYLAHLQRDGTGLIVFADQVTHYVPPSSRQGQLNRMLHAIDAAETGKKTDFSGPLNHLQEVLKRKAITVLISDFFEDPEVLLHSIEPLQQRGNELILFHVLDPGEMRPELESASLLVDMETGEAMEASPDYARVEYAERMRSHLEALRTKTRGHNIGYHLLQTDKPLDMALREYFRLRERKI